MAVQILDGTASGVGHACLFCTTTDWAFGPVFLGADAREQAECWYDWFADGEAVRAGGVRLHSGFGDGTDPREYDSKELERLHSIWRGKCTDDDGHLLYRELPDGSTGWTWRAEAVAC